MKNFRKGHDSHDKAKVAHHGPPAGEAVPEAGPPGAGGPGERGAPEKQAGETAGVLPAAPVLTEAQQVKDRLLRLQADFDNFRKRNVREKIETVRRANEELLIALLPILDNLELTIEHARERATEDAFVEGVRIVRDEFLGILQKFGVTTFETVGQPFDPNRHEAIARLPSADQPEGTVLVQTRRGFLLGDMLLRAAQVVVAAQPAAPAAENAPGEEAAEEA